MAIAIKEILASDNIRQLAEKVNANFDQLLLNGGGEQGIMGEEGIEGPVGATGTRGALWFYGTSDPNSFQVTLDPLYEGDYYLQSSGKVWSYTGTEWYDTALNLTGPQGTEAGSLIKSGGGNVISGSAPYDGEDFVFIKPSPDLYLATGGFEIKSMLIGGYPNGSTDPSSRPIGDEYALSISAQTTGILFVHSYNAATPHIVLSGGTSTNTIKPNYMPNISSSIYDQITIFNPRIVADSPMLEGINLNTTDSNINLSSFRDINIIAKGNPGTESRANTGSSAGSIEIWSDDIDRDSPSYIPYNVANSLVIKNTRTDKYNVIKNTALLELKTVNGDKSGNRYVNINTLNNDNDITVRLGYVNTANSSGYGIFIREVTGPSLTDKYGIYQSGSDVKNYFEGSLEVLNGYSISGDIAVTQSSTNNGMLRLNGIANSTGPMLMIYNPDQATYDYTKIGARDGNSFSVEKDTANSTGVGTYILAIDESNNRLTIQGDIYRDSSLYLSSNTLGSSIIYSSLTTVGTITTGTWTASDVGVSYGGTGASTASGARTNLGLTIGTNVQAWDTNLDEIAAFTPTNSNFIVGNGSSWVIETGNTARTSLGLGTGNSPGFTNVTLSGTLYVTSTANIGGTNFRGHLNRESSIVGGFVGTYDYTPPDATTSLGDTRTHTNPIYTIGPSYIPYETTLNNMYGIGFSNTTASFLSTAQTAIGDKWGLYLAASGTATIFLDSTSGNIWQAGALAAVGNVYSNSKLIGYGGSTLGKASTTGGVLDLYDTTDTSKYRSLRVNSNELQFSYENTTSFVNILHAGNYTSYTPYISGKKSFTPSTNGWYMLANTAGNDFASCTFEINGRATDIHSYAKLEASFVYGEATLNQISGVKYSSTVPFTYVAIATEDANPAYNGAWLCVYCIAGSIIEYGVTQTSNSYYNNWHAINTPVALNTDAYSFAVELAYVGSRGMQSASTIYAPSFNGSLSGNASSATTAAACTGNSATATTATTAAACTGNSATATHATTAATCTGNSATATTAAAWTTTRNISLVGDATGNVNINGSADVSMTVNVSSITGSLSVSGNLSVNSAQVAAAILKVNPNTAATNSGDVYHNGVHSGNGTQKVEPWTDTGSGTWTSSNDGMVDSASILEYRNIKAIGYLQVEFYYDVQAQEDRDFFIFRDDISGTEYIRTSEDQDDYSRVFPPGEYSFVWIYEKDDSVDEYADRAFIADITFTEIYYLDLAGSTIYNYNNSVYVNDNIRLTGDIYADGTIRSVGTIYSSGKGNSSQWNTAYTWGDHALGGYLSAAEEITSMSFKITSGVLTLIKSTAANVSLDIDGRYVVQSSAGTITPDNNLNTSLGGSSDRWPLIYGDIVNINDDLKFNTSASKIRFHPSTYTGDEQSVMLSEDGGDFLVETNNAGSQSFEMRFLDTGNGTLSGSWSSTSDRRYKENVESVYLDDDFLNKLNAIRIVSYDKIEVYNPNKLYGVIAQELQELFPEYITEHASEFADDEGPFLGVTYSHLSLLGIRGVQKLIDKNKELENKLETLEKRFELLEANLNK